MSIILKNSLDGEQMKKMNVHCDISRTVTVVESCVVNMYKSMLDLNEECIEAATYSAILSYKTI